MVTITTASFTIISHSIYLMCFFFVTITRPVFKGLACLKVVIKIICTFLDCLLVVCCNFSALQRTEHKKNLLKQVTTQRGLFYHNCHFTTLCILRMSVPSPACNTGKATLHTVLVLTLVKLSRLVFCWRALLLQ